MLGVRFLDDVIDVGLPRMVKRMPDWVDGSYLGSSQRSQQDTQSEFVGSASSRIISPGSS